MLGDPFTLTGFATDPPPISHGVMSPPMLLPNEGWTIASKSPLTIKLTCACASVGACRSSIPSAADITAVPVERMNRLNLTREIFSNAADFCMGDIFLKNSFIMRLFH